jgi:hypothetical protein
MQRFLAEKERLSTVDLLILATCFVKEIAFSKADDLN